VADQEALVVQGDTTAILQTVGLLEQEVFQQPPIPEQMVVPAVMLWRFWDVALLPDRYREGTGQVLLR